MRTLFEALALGGALSLLTLTACGDKEESCDCEELDTAESADTAEEPAAEPEDTGVEPEPVDTGSEPEDTGSAEETGQEDTGGE